MNGYNSHGSKPSESKPGRSKPGGETGEQVFTREELAVYNGLNGKPAYVAVNGVVFDVSTVFIRGEHFSHPAGQDLTGAFLRQHVPSALAGYPIVGRLTD